METKLKIFQSAILLSVIGDLDYYESKSAVDFFSIIPTKETKPLIVDLKEARHVSSSGLRLFKNLSENYYKKTNTLPSIKGASHFIRESFILAGIEDQFVWLEGYSEDTSL